MKVNVPCEIDFLSNCASFFKDHTKNVIYFFLHFKTPLIAGFAVFGVDSEQMKNELCLPEA